MQNVQKKLEISFNFRIDKRIELVKFSILLWDKILTLTNYKKTKKHSGRFMLLCSENWRGARGFSQVVVEDQFLEPSEQTNE